MTVMRAELIELPSIGMSRFMLRHCIDPLSNFYQVRCLMSYMQILRLAQRRKSRTAFEKLSSTIHISLVAVFTSLVVYLG
jgi:hypothetical protein